MDYVTFFGWCWSVFLLFCLIAMAVLLKSLLFDDDDPKSEQHDHLDPTDGGCWFCCKGHVGASGLIFFSDEFDTYFHMECLVQALQHGHPETHDVEARLIALEFIPPTGYWNYNTERTDLELAQALQDLYIKSLS